MKPKKKEKFSLSMDSIQQTYELITRLLMQRKKTPSKVKAKLE
jgi:hypothetical protein